MRPKALLELTDDPKKGKRFARDYRATFLWNLRKRGITDQRSTLGGQNGKSIFKFS